MFREIKDFIQKSSASLKEWNEKKSLEGQERRLKDQERQVKLAVKWCQEQKEVELQSLRGRSAVVAYDLWRNLFMELEKKTPSIKLIKRLKKESLSILALQTVNVVECSVNDSTALKNRRLLDEYMR